MTGVQTCALPIWTARTILWQEAENNGGSYPSNLSQIASSPRLNPPDTHDGERPKWKDYYYVSGLKESDPSWLPMIIYLSDDATVPGGGVLFVGGVAYWTTNEAMLKDLIQSPLKASQKNGISGVRAEQDRGRMDDPQARMELFTRVKVLQPIGTGGAK